MDDRVDCRAEQWEPRYREAFEYTSTLLDEYHPEDLETVSAVVSKCYPALFETVADAVANEDDGSNTTQPHSRQERALDDLDAEDPEAQRSAARTLLELAREESHLFETAVVRGRIVDHRRDEAVRPLLHGVLRQIAMADADSDGNPPDRTPGLTSDDDERRRVAAAAFAQGGVSRYSERESEVDALIDLVTDHTASVGARSQAARALSYRDDRSNYRPRPTRVVPSLIEIAGSGNADGRGGAAALLTETVFQEPDTFDDETRNAVAETVADTIGDEDYRVRLRALSPLCEYRPFENVPDEQVATIGDAVATACADDHPVVAERADTAWSELPVDESDVSAEAVSATRLRTDTSLKEQVKALDEDDPDELATNWATIVDGLDDQNASRFAASRAKALALADPEAVLGSDGAIRLLTEHLVAGNRGRKDVAVALGSTIVADPSVAHRDTALHVLGWLGYVGTFAGDRLPGRGWITLGVAAGGKSADGADDSVRRVRTYVDHLDVDPIEFLAALWNDERTAIATIAADARDQIGTAEGVGARAVIALADIDPALWGDALPAAIRALERADEDDRVKSLATIRSAAATDPERVAVAIDELLALLFEPHPEIREEVARICWYVGRTDTSAARRPAVTALAAYDEDDAERQPLWPAGAIAREEPELVEAALLQAVEDRLTERSNRTDGEHLGNLIAEVHAGDPDVGRPAVDRLLATIDDDYPELASNVSIRADVSAVLATVADKYAETIVEAVEGIAAYAQSANWSSHRGMQNAVLTLDALVAENHDDAVYAALRKQIPRGGDAERNSYSGYVRRHGYFADESEQIADLYLDAALAERATDRKRLETASRGLLDYISADSLVELPDEEARALVPEIAGRFKGETDDGDGKLEALAESKPEVVAAHVGAVGELLDEYWSGPRTVGATVARTLASYDPTAIRPITKQLAGRVADEDDEYVLRASADALRRLASVDPGLVAAALADRFDNYDTDADAPAEVLARCDEFDAGDASRSGGLVGLLSRSSDDRPSTRQIVVECFETAGVDPERTDD